MAAPAHRTERLLNLVICLLSTRSWLTKEQIRAAVPQYADCATDEAFDRMFERDKEDLRELGVPLATGSHSAWFEDEQGYRIDRSAYALPDLEFTPEELAVLGLASRVWQQASLAGPAARALVKLKALGVETDEESLVGVEPRVRAAEPAFEPLYAATRDRAPVTFAYRSREGETSTRRLEPWVLTSRGGHWYVVGHDRDRGARRSFRLSRIEGAVHRIGAAGSYQLPEDLDVAADLVSFAPEQHDERVAVLRVRAGRAVLLRRRAVAVEPDLEEGWDVLHVAVRDAADLAHELAGYGPDVVALAPPDVRAAVVRVLRAALSPTGGSDGGSEGRSERPAGGRSGDRSGEPAAQGAS
jgi:proteasome accessory factor B